MEKSPTSLYRLLARRSSGASARRIEGGVERVDPLEREEVAAGEPPRLVQLAAFDEVEEDVEGGRPGADADGGAGFGQRFGDGEAEAAVVGDAGDEGAFAGEIDGEHAVKVRSEAAKGQRPEARGQEAATPEHGVHPS